MEEQRPSSRLTFKEKSILLAVGGFVFLGVYFLLVVSITTVIFGPKHQLLPHITSGFGGFILSFAHKGVLSYAYPAQYRGYFPSNIVQQVLSIIYTAVFIGVLVGGWMYYDKHHATFHKITGPRYDRKLRVGVSPASHMAGLEDIKQLIVPGPTKGRITLGYFASTDGKVTSKSGNVLLATEDTGPDAVISPDVDPTKRAGRSSVIIFAPAQAGKSTGLAYPSVVDWDGPVLAASVKSDVLRNTIRAREDMIAKKGEGSGSIKIFDPRHTLAPWGIDTNLWSPLSGITSFNSAMSIARSFKPINKGGGDMDFWFNLAVRLIACYFYTASISDRDMSDVLVWLNTKDSLNADPAEVSDILTNIKLTSSDTLMREDAGRCLLMLQSVSLQKQGQATGADKTLDSIVITAQSLLVTFEDTDLSKTKENVDLITPAWLLSGYNTLYIAAPASQQRDIEGVFVGLIQSVIEYAYDYANRKGGELPFRLLVLLDEAANIAPLSDLDVYASTAPSHGIQLVTIFQDYAQVESRWGQDKARSIFNNHQAKLLMGAIHDNNTLRLFSDLTGQEEYVAVSQNYQEKGINESKSVQSRAHLPVDVIRRMPLYHALLLYRNLPPIFVRLRSAFNDPALAETLHSKDVDYLDSLQTNTQAQVGSDLFDDKR